MYTPTFTYINMTPWDIGNELFGTNLYTALPDSINFACRAVLGDMNRDDEMDVIVGYGGGIAVYTGFADSGEENLELIWNYEDLEAFDGGYAPPVLMDCNGDSFLDIIAGVSIYDQDDPGYRLVILDGSPYNNHNRYDSTDRILWTWGPVDEDLVAYTQSPVLTESNSNTLELRMVFWDPQYDNDALYKALDTLYGSHDEAYQPNHWLKAFYNLSNWSNVEEAGAPYN